MPVGTGREIASIIREQRPEASFDVVSNPEFLREGSAIGDFMRPDRVVVGVESARAQAVMRALYRPLFLIETPVLFTTLETAELIKYAANCFLATKIAFINEIADLCERLGADVQDVAKGIGLDGRIGRYFLHAGPGFGGSCFPTDTAALSRIAEEAGSPSAIVDAVLRSNDARKARMVGKIAEACGGSVAGKTVAVLGVTFKPNTDDVSESPSLVILPGLMERGAVIRAFDPAGMEEARRVLDGVVWCRDPYDAMAGADALVIPHRVERVQGARPGACQELAEDAADRRSAQHLRPGRGSCRRLSLCECRPASSRAERRRVPGGLVMSGASNRQRVNSRARAGVPSCAGSDRS